MYGESQKTHTNRNPRSPLNAPGAWPYPYPSHSSREYVQYNPFALSYPTESSLYVQSVCRTDALLFLS